MPRSRRCRDDVTVCRNCLLCGGVKLRIFLSSIDARNVKDQRLRDFDARVRYEGRVLRKPEDVFERLVFVPGGHDKVPIWHLAPRRN